MAGKLSEKIKQSASNLRQAQQAAPAGTATEQAFQQAAVAKGTAGTPTPSGQSNISEVLGVQEQRAAGEQAAQQIEQQAEQAQVAEAQQESKDVIRDATMRAQRLETDAKFNQELENQLNKYEQFSLDMDAAEEDLALEDLGAKLALKDKKYQAELQRRGDAARLQDANNFKEESQKLVMGESLKNFRDNIKFQEEQQDLDLQSMEDLAKLDIDSALAAADAAMAEALRQQQSQAFSQLGSAAASVVGDEGAYKGLFGGGSAASATPATTASTTRTTGIIPKEG